MQARTQHNLVKLDLMPVTTSGVVPLTALCVSGVRYQLLVLRCAFT